MKRNCFFLAACMLLLSACAGSDSPGKEDIPGTMAAETTPVTKTVFDLEPALATTNSLQVLFYDDPNGDSIRYSRLFTFAETTDTAQVQSLLQALNQVYVQEPQARPCRSEGKLYLLREEDVLKTVYFSTWKDNCRYFYLIKDGTFIYLPLTDWAAAWLQKSRKVAKKP